MKKITSIILIISVLISMYVGVCSAADADIPVKELTVFNSLGITAVDLNSDYDGNKKVTRAEFAELVAKAIKAKDESGDRIFSDIPEQHQASGSINALYKLGIIDPADDGKFNPDTYITYEQALKIIVCALGYNRVALIEGEKMTTYLATASKLGIELKGVGAKDEINYTQGIKLLYEGMFTNILVYDSGTNYKVSEDETLFSRYYDLYEGEGVLTAVYGCEVSSMVNAKENYIAVGDTVYELNTGYIADDLIGEYCEFVYSEDNGDSLIYYAESVEKKNEVIRIAGDTLKGYNTKTQEIEYYKNINMGKTDSEKISSQTVMVYNGKVSGLGISEVIKKFTDEGKRGEIKLVDNNKDGNFEFLIVTCYDLFIIGGYNETDGVIYEQNDPKKQFKTEDKKALTVLNQHNVKTQMPTTNSAVLLIAESEDGKYAKVLVCEKKLNGVITSVDNEEKTVVLSTGETVKFDFNVWENKNISDSLNIEVTIILDKYGYGVDIVKNNTGGFKVVYLRSANVVDDSEFGIYFKVFTEDSTHVRYRLADKVTVDGVSYKVENYRQLANAFPGDSEVYDANGDVSIKLQRQVLRIKLNKNEEITTIDTSIIANGEDAENSLRKIHSREWLTFNSNIPRFGLDVLYSTTATKVFVAPNVNADGQITLNGIQVNEDESMYKIGYSFIWDTAYPLETYKYQSDTETTDVVVYLPDPTIAEKQAYMYMGTGKMVAEDGEVVNYIEGYGYEGIKKWQVDDSAIDLVLDLEPGDLYEVMTDYESKRATTVKKVYDMGTDTFNNGGLNEFWYANSYEINGGWNYRNAKLQASKVMLYDWVNNTMKGTYKKEDIEAGVINEMAPTNKAPAIVFDKDAEKNQVYKGSFGEAKTYKAYGDDCSKVLTYLNGSYLRAFFIYK